jgi:hypothetical protein
VQARPSMPAGPGAPCMTIAEAPEEIEAELITAEDGAEETVMALAHIGRRGRPMGPRPCSVETRHLRGLLHSTSGLRAAFVLSEILAPPVALRENPPFESREHGGASGMT